MTGHAARLHLNIGVSMMDLTIRFLVAGTAVVAIHMGVRALRGGGTAIEVRLPEQDLREMPLRFGSWKGEEDSLNPRVLRGMGAVAAVNRRYRNNAGDMVYLHGGIWDKYSLPHGIHRAEICYISEGYQVVNQEDLQLQGSDDSSFPARLLTVERDGQTLSVLYWYHIGDRVAVSYGDMRRAYWSLRTKRIWPPVIKVMLQTSAADTDQALDRLESVALPVFEWTRELR